ncbi:TonB-dependent receptor domain-containing protein [Yoonia vestfoldensis]|uniref:Colicin I receptor n=1 Tax=Yoonia vestfoldensis TaxID=245188 RepID=A0A1Y0EC34_9RHOB|nr:TonB-dependent receptor [Yoonia vestfoldensis]ARU01166.1 colicin I receptor [Yoonia vestfoldensis]
MRIATISTCKTLASLLLCPLPYAALAQEPAPFDLGSLILSAAGIAVDPLTAPASVTVVTGAELETAGVSDLTDALRGVPGVAVAGGTDAENILIRGMPAEYTLLLVDGQRLNSRQSRTNGSGGVDQYFIPPVAAIARIEILRGPMSALYGSDAIGGVINIITKPVAPVWTGSVTVETMAPVESDDSAQTQGTYYLSGPLAGETLGLQLWGRRLDRAGSSRLENGSVVGADDRDVTDHTARLTWAPWATETFFLQFGGTDMRRSGDATEFDDRRRTAALGYEGARGGWDLTTLLAQEEAQRETSTSRTGRAPEITTTSFDFKASGTAGAQGNHGLTLGLQILDTAIRDQNLGLGETETTRFDNRQWAVFAEDVWDLTDRVTLTLGARYTDDATFGGALTPRAYATYAITDHLVLAGGVSTGYKTPELRETTQSYYSCTGGSCARAVVPGNPDLEPEESTSYELGLRYETGLTTAAITAYKTDFRNRIDSRDTGTQFSGTTDLYEWFNIGKAETAGVEITASHFVTARVKIGGSYSYTHSEQLTGDLQGEPFSRTPSHQASLRFDWQTARPGLDLWAAANYIGDSSTASISRGAKVVTEYDGYATLDIGLSYPLNDQLTLRGAVFNLTDTAITQEDQGTAKNGQTLQLGLTATF